MEIALSNIIASLEVIAFHGDENTIVSEIVALDNGVVTDASILWCSDKFKEKLRGISCGNVIVSEETYSWILEWDDNKNAINWIVVNNPRAAFSLVLSTYFYKADKFGQVADSAKIHSSVKFDRNTVNIGENVVVEEGVVIGDNVKIGHNSVILSDCVLGNNVKIGSNSTVGGSGFGYEVDADGLYNLIPHIGNVVLKDNVEIGNGVAIDRAVLGSTLLMENVKVDNLVHISHGVKVGKNTLIIANAMIAGSCDVGENVWISPSVSVIQKVKIGDNSLIGVGSVVLKDVDESVIVAGVPAKKIKDK